MSKVLSPLFAGLAVAVSIYTWHVQRSAERAANKRAHVTVYFHWLTARATVRLPDNSQVQARYHLVIHNRGPATAREVNVEVFDRDGQKLRLLDLSKGELPLGLLDAGIRYPIPWIVEPFERHARRFRARLSWVDDEGPHERSIPLRRGQLPPG